MSDWQVREQERYDEEEERQLKNRPCCAWCEEPIQEEYAYDLGNGEIVCEDCIRDARTYIDD